MSGVPNELPNKSEVKRDDKGRIVEGSGPLNPAGRPKGKTLKEYAREYLMNLPDEEKMDYLSTLPKDVVWKMAEGNPHNTQDLTSDDKPLSPILVEFINGKETED